MKPVSNLPMNFVTILDILSRSLQTSRVAICFAVSIGFCAIPVAGVKGVENSKPHLLRDGDLLRIDIFGVPKEDREEISRCVRVVSNSGHIRLPFLKSEVLARGATPIELARSLESAYRSARIYKAPLIAVNRAVSCDDTRHVNIFGSVPNPVAQVWSEKMTAAEAIAMCGGFADDANPRMVRLFRDGRSIDLDLSVIDSFKTTPILHPGDILVVPKAPEGLSKISPSSNGITPSRASAGKG